MELTFTPDVYIEFIPGFIDKEIDKLENKFYGNLNETVFLTAQTLNSIVALKYGGAGSSPNAAFHSDEGGRPGVEGVDYDSAVFLPATLAAMPDPMRTAAGSLQGPQSTPQLATCLNIYSKPSKALSPCPARWPG